ncbi:hypothetical protein ACS3UN_08290 [Oscillospiraceae bacterium LTW-04]|nr:glycosyltransferase [Oscillospiraceae bacterium MB24-C1]
MRGVYLTTYDITNPSDGVAKKIVSQIKCFENAGFDMIIVDANDIPSGNYYKFRKIISKFLATAYVTGCLYDYLINNIDLNTVDFIYIRKGYCDIRQIHALKKIKRINPSIKILMEIPTYPYDQEFGGRRRFLAIPRDKKARKYLYKYLDRIVTYSVDPVIFGIPTLRISNGIDYKKVSLKNTKTHDGINIIAVALFDYWHGYDRILMGIANQKDVVKTNGVVFHMVGEGRALTKYKEIVEENSLEDNVVFHGRLFGEALETIYDVCDIGIDTLARHRVGVNYNSTLKGKEYCAKGLPIISGVITELDDMNCDYYHRVPANDDAVLIDEIVDFYHCMYDGKDAALVAESIRKQSQQIFHFPNTFASIVEYIKKK